MKLSLDYKVQLEDQALSSADAMQKIDAIKEDLGDLEYLEGSLQLTLDGEAHCAEVVDPVMRLAYQWIRRLPWVISGDTETVAYRDSEHCFAFVPAGDSVELSFFTGSESEIDEYVLEPVTVRLDNFVETSLRMASKALEFALAIDPDATNNSETVKDLSLGLQEAQRAWKEHQKHQRH